MAVNIQPIYNELRRRPIEIPEKRKGRERIAAALAKGGSGNYGPVYHPAVGAFMAGADMLSGYMEGKAARDAAAAEEAERAALMGAIQGFQGGGASSPSESGAEQIGGPAPASAPADLGVSENEVFASFMDTVKSEVTNPYGLAAVAATGKHESRFDPKNAVRTWSDPSESGQPGQSGGVMSWRGPRYAAMAKGGDLSPAAQAQYFLREDPQLIASLNNAKSVEEAASLMANAWRFAGYNRPGGEAAARLATARSFLPMFQGGEPQYPQVANMGGGQMLGEFPNAAQTGGVPFSGQQGRFDNAFGAGQPPGAPPMQQFDQAARAMDAARMPAENVAQGQGAGFPQAQNFGGGAAPQAVPAMQRIARALTPGQTRAFQPEEAGSAMVPSLRPTPTQPGMSNMPPMQSTGLVNTRNPLSRIAGAILSAGGQRPGLPPAMQQQGVPGAPGGAQQAPMGAGGPAGIDFSVLPTNALIQVYKELAVDEYKRNTPEGRLAFENAQVELEKRRFDLDKARQEAAQEGQPPSHGGDFKITQDLRKEYQGRPEFKAWKEVDAGYQKLRAAAELGTGQSDTAMIFGYMKILDPGSTVREGEAATVEQAQGVPSQVLNLYNRIVAGERLSPEARRDIVQAAQAVYATQRDTFLALQNEYSGYAGQWGIRPEAIFAPLPPVEEMDNESFIERFGKGG